MTTQSNHNPFEKQQGLDRYELTVMGEDLTIQYLYCTSYRHLSDGRLLMERRTRKAGCATNPKVAQKFQVLRIRDFLA